MVVLLPAARDGPAALQDALTVGNLADLLDRLRTQRVAVSIPRLSTTSRFELPDHLARMGMPAAFSGAADFWGMNGRRHDLSPRADRPSERRGGVALPEVESPIRDQEHGPQTASRIRKSRMPTTPSPSRSAG